MLNIFFSDSAYGNYLASGLKQRDEELCTLSIMLDVGSINEDILGEYRKKLYTKMYSYMFNEQADRCVDEYFDKSIAAYNKILETAQKGQKVRIWLDKDPAAVCEFYWLCGQLRDHGLSENSTVLETPDVVYSNGKKTRPHSWGCICSDELKSIPRVEEPLTYEEIQTNAAKWDELKKADTLLRTIIDDEVVSVPEDSYDEKIMRLIPKTPIQTSEAQGKFFCQNDIGISSLIIDWRFAMLEKQGKIVRLKKGERQAFNIIKRA